MNSKDISHLLKKSVKEGLTIGEYTALKEHLEAYHSKPLTCLTIHELWDKFELIGFPHPLKERGLEEWL